MTVESPLAMGPEAAAYAEFQRLYPQRSATWSDLADWERERWRRIIAAAAPAIEPAVPGRCASPLDASRPCTHVNFAANLEVNRLTDSDTPDAAVTGYAASITVWCADCGERFRWTGAGAGLMPGRPMCSVDETELRAPLRPASADPDFGLGIPGFAVHYRQA